MPLRRGPGNDYPVVDQLSLHDSVIGRGTSRSDTGNAWIWVTRASDGVSGFVMRKALLERPLNASPVEADATATKPDCIDPDACPDRAPAPVAANKVLDARYRQLLAGADGYDRAYLMESQRLWEEQRRRCDVDSQPVICRETADAQRMGDLQGWSDAEKMTKQEEAQKPALTQASLGAAR